MRVQHLLGGSPFIAELICTRGSCRSNGYLLRDLGDMTGEIHITRYDTIRYCTAGAGARSSTVFFGINKCTTINIRATPFMYLLREYRAFVYSLRGSILAQRYSLLRGSTSSIVVYLHDSSVSLFGSFDWKWRRFTR